MKRIGSFFRSIFRGDNSKKESFLDESSLPFYVRHDGSQDTEVLEPFVINFEELTVLVIDDNPFLRDSTGAFLQNLGAAVDCAENGAIGLECYLKAPDRYNLIFLDIEMPVMGGIETAMRIRDSHLASSKTIPIIAVTGSMFWDDPRMPLFTGSIRKPFELDKLISFLKQPFRCSR